MSEQALRAGLEHLIDKLKKTGCMARVGELQDLLRAQPPDLKEPASWIDRWWEEHEGRLSAMRELRASQAQQEAALRLVRVFYEKIGEHARVGVVGQLWLDAKALMDAGQAQPPPAPQTELRVLYGQTPLPVEPPPAPDLGALHDAIQQLPVSRMEGTVNGEPFSYVLVRRSDVHAAIEGYPFRPVAASPAVEGTRSPAGKQP